MSLTLEGILTAASKLPPFPKVAQKIQVLLSDPYVSASRLAEVAQLDPALTANVLKAVNSAYYSLPRKVENVNQALAYLGNQQFQEVVWMSAAVRFLFREQPGYGLSRGDLWQHSLATAMMTQILAGRSGLHNPSPALYTSALLHDIGKVILSSFVQDQVKSIIKLVDEGASFIEAERQVLGLDHAQLGGQVAKKWEFSQEMVDLITYHHQPDAKPDWPELAILYLANLTAQMLGIGGGVDGLATRGQVSALKLVQLKERDLELAMAELQEHLTRAEAMLNLS